VRPPSPLRRWIGDGVVWDNHACMPLDPHDLSRMPELERCRQAGVDVVSINVASGDQPPVAALRMLAAFRQWIADHDDSAFQVECADDAERARALGKIGICFDVEGMAALGGRLDMVQRLYELGVRWMLTAYNRGNAVGGGCLDEEDGGLTPFGRAVVAEMNRVGMVVCGSHAGHRTARELIDASATPVIFSHSNPRTVWNSARNIDDDLMIACARRGGVVGLNGIGAFLGSNDDRTESFVRHVDYALDLIGEDHVGLALDYCFGEEGGLRDFIGAFPTLFPPEHGYMTDGLRMIAPWRLGEIAEMLATRGIGTSTLGKLFGGNHLRIARTVWK